MWVSPHHTTARQLSSVSIRSSNATTSPCGRSPHPSMRCRTESAVGLSSPPLRFVESGERSRIPVLAKRCGETPLFSQPIPEELKHARVCKSGEHTHSPSRRITPPSVLPSDGASPIFDHTLYRQRGSPMLEGRSKTGNSTVKSLSPSFASLPRLPPLLPPRSADHLRATISVPACGIRASMEGSVLSDGKTALSTGIGSVPGMRHRALHRYTVSRTSLSLTWCVVSRLVRFVLTTPPCDVRWFVWTGPSPWSASYRSDHIGVQGSQAFAGSSTSGMGYVLSADMVKHGQRTWYA